MLSLTTFSSLRSCAIWSSTRAIAWHGPHHSAQKSTSTGWSAPSTSLSKVCSVTAFAISSFLPQVSDSPNARESAGVPARYDQTHGAGLHATAERARPPGSGTGDPCALGGGGHLRPPAGAERLRPPLPLHGRPDYGQRSRRGPPRNRAHPQGRLPALQGAARLRPAVPERLRFPGPARRGPGREGAWAQLQTGDRGVRRRRVRAPLPRVRRRVRGRPDGSVQAPRPVDGLGRRLLHVLGHEHRVHLALPAGVPSPRLALQGPPLDAVVPALRHLALQARAGGRRELRRARASVALRELPLEGTRRRGAR